MYTCRGMIISFNADTCVGFKGHTGLVSPTISCNLECTLYSRYKVSYMPHASHHTPIRRQEEPTPFFIIFLVYCAYSTTNTKAKTKIALHFACRAISTFSFRRLSTTLILSSPPPPPFTFLSLLPSSHIAICIALLIPHLLLISLIFCLTVLSKNKTPLSQRMITLLLSPWPTLWPVAVGESRCMS